MSKNFYLLNLLYPGSRFFGNGMLCILLLHLGYTTGSLPVSFLNPFPSVFSQAARRHYHVDMRVVTQVLTPRMQYTYCACLGPKVFRVFGTLKQRLSGCLEKITISRPLIDVKKVVQTMGTCLSLGTGKVILIQRCGSICKTSLRLSPEE